MGKPHAAHWEDTGQRWLCLYFPALAIDYWQRQQVEPVALGLYEASQLVACSAAAAQAGVEAGMSVAGAQALLPSIVLRPHEPAQAASLLRALAQWAYGFTSAVMPEPPRQILLELAASERLFGGLPALLERLEAELQGWGCDVAVGLAPTAMGARLLAVAAHRPMQSARAGQSRFRNQAGRAAHADLSLSVQLQALQAERWPQLLQLQSLALLPLSKVSLQRLQRAGFHTLGQLLRLPLASIGKRFDQSLVQLLRKLQGLAPELPKHFNEPPLFDRNQVFLYGLTDTGHLQPPIQALLAELKQFLRQRQLVCKCVCWRFVYVSRDVAELRVSVQRAHADINEFSTLTQLKLEQFRMAEPVEVVGLRVETFGAAEVASGGLFPELGDAGEDAGRLLDRLYQRLPPDQLFSVRLQDEHLPDAQQCAVRATSKGATQKVRSSQLPEVSKGKRPAARNAEGVHGGAQTYRHSMASVFNAHGAVAFLSPWLFPEPQPLLQRAGQLRWQGEVITLISLAERIDSHWWAVRQRRDYFVARVGARYLRIFFCHHRQQWFGAGVYVC